MERIKKIILQAVNVEVTDTGKRIIVPDLSVYYSFKIGLKQVANDIGFFDAYIEPEVVDPPEPPAETFNLVDSN